MEFVLLGFDQSASIRRFQFESIDGDHTRTPVAVVADLTLARQYNIQVQNLPLLCRQLLSETDPGTLAAGLVIFTASHMDVLCKAEQVKIRDKKPRRVRTVVSPEVGKAWRAPMIYTSAVGSA